MKGWVKGLWLQKSQVNWVTCLAVNSARMGFNGVCACSTEIAVFFCACHSAFQEKDLPEDSECSCLKSELRTFLTSKLLTFGNTDCFQIVVFYLLCISLFQLLGQKLSNLSWFFSLRENTNKIIHVCGACRRNWCVLWEYLLQ